jgi:lipopolysaccharide export system protein LptA
MKPHFLAALLLLAAPVAHAANEGISLGKHDTNAPIQVSADQFSADMNAKSGTYSGNVIVTQGDMHLRANTVRISTVNSKPDKIVANGNVVFDSASSGTATGDTGVYEVGPRLINFTGRVVLTKGKNVMRGTNLQVNLVTGRATLNAAGSKQGGGRVQGIFTPPPQSNSSSQTKP